MFAAVAILDIAALPPGPVASGGKPVFKSAYKHPHLEQCKIDCAWVMPKPVWIVYHAARCQPGPRTTPAVCGLRVFPETVGGAEEV